MKFTTKDLHPEGRPFSKEEFINKIKTDDKFAEKWGELGPIYGKQWRGWSGIDDSEMRMTTYGIDQISNLIKELKTNPDSRRLIVNAWNVGKLDQMVLPPCHYGFQVYTRELSLKEKCNWLNKNYPSYGLIGFTIKDLLDEEYLKGVEFEYNMPTRAISLMWNQRSVDTALGLPFNIASYAILLQLIGKIVNMVPEELIGNLGDTHLYSNHLEGAKEQIGRELTLDERSEIWNNTHNPIGNIFTHNQYDENELPKRTREPFPLPTLSFSNLVDIDIMKYVNVNTMNLDILFSRLTPTDFIIEDYQSHPKIDFPLSN